MVNSAADDFLEERYYQEGEDWEKLCCRVADFHADTPEEFKEYFDMLSECKALPNSPALMNSGTKTGYLSACNLIPVPDDLEGIMDAVKATAMIQKGGGGTGLNFSDLRPAGDTIKGTGGVSSGPVSFLRLFNVCGQVIKQGGKRRSAQLGLLRYDHPDILRWIHVKDEDGDLTGFNLSVGLDDEFFEKVKQDEDVVFINPRTKEPFAAYDPDSGSHMDAISARGMLNIIAESMWKSGEPGIIFWDALQRGNPTPNIGPLHGVNPCGESPLRHWESCCLGSVNLYEHIKDREIDYDAIATTTKVMTRMLNSIIDKNVYPIPHMQYVANLTRKIGIGVMAFADVLGVLGIRYGSDESIKVIENIMGVISCAAGEESDRLAKEYKPYPAWVTSNGPKRRNSTLISMAPTGSISFIAGVSSGIEPFFKMGYKMNRENKEPLIVISRSFLDDLDTRGINKDKVLPPLLTYDLTPNQLIEEGKLTEDFSHYVTAGEVSPEEHIRVQAMFQKYTDLAVSKTINIPNQSTIYDVYHIIKLAHKSNCKGITVFRDGCLRGAFLTEIKCSSCGTTNLEHKEGCITCADCGMSLCSVS